MNDHTVECMERDEYRCVRCGANLGQGWPGYSCHHRQLRSGGGQNTLGNLIMLCGTGTTGCHGWAHHNRAASQTLGYIVSRYAKPEEQPVWHWQLGWVLYANDGGCTTQPQLPRPDTPDPGVNEKERANTNER